MMLKIPKDSVLKEFVYDYLPWYMYNIIEGSIDNRQIDRLKIYFRFDPKEVILYTFLHLYIYSDSNYYYISIDKNLKYNNLFANQLIKMITYGNLTTKGYPIVTEVFNKVENNLSLIYQDWQNIY